MEGRSDEAKAAIAAKIIARGHDGTWAKLAATDEPDHYAIIRKIGSFVGKAIAFVVVVSMLVGLLVWRGYAAVTLWRWFVEPIWPSFWHPTIYSAVGVMATISVFLPHPVSPKKTAKYAWLQPFLTPAAALAFGWLWMWLQWGA